METKNLTELVEELEKAKNAVLSCLNNEGCLVNMHGLEYWASVVENLRKEIKERL